MRDPERERANQKRYYDTHKEAKASRQQEYLAKKREDPEFIAKRRALNPQVDTYDLPTDWADDVEEF